MKKITFMMIALLCTVVAFAAGPKRQFDAQLSKPAKTQVQFGKQINPKQALKMPTKRVPAGKLQAPASNSKFRTMAAKARAKGITPRKAKAADVFSLIVGENKMLISDYYEVGEEGKLIEAAPAMGGTLVSVTQIDDRTIGIDGFTADAEETIQATVELTEDEDLLKEGVVATLAIPEGQTLFTRVLEGDKPGEEIVCVVVLGNATAEGDITGYVFDDGTIYLADLWYDYLGKGSTEEYLDYMWSGLVYSSLIVTANGTMDWTSFKEDQATHEVQTVKQSVNVYIYQDPESPKTATIYNFAGWETAIVVDMKEDQTFEIKSQLVEDGGETYGMFYTYGLSDDESTIFANLTGVGTETTLTIDGKFTAYAETGYWYGSQGLATITMTDGEFAYPFIPDVAAMPADPAIASVGAYDPEKDYGYVIADVPVTDVDGNDIKESKLYYVLYADVKGEITPITYPAELYKNLDEDLTEIPYTLDDGYDFQAATINDHLYKVVYLNWNFNDYDRIGIQSIYRGGDKENVTEIQWVTYEKPNPVWVAAAQGYENETVVESITFTDTDVTGTLTAGTNSASPTYYEEGESLRMYSTNTLTITSQKPMAKILFTFADDASANQKKLEAEGYDAESGVWKGEATSVTFAVPAKTGLTAPQARISKIEVVYVGAPEDVSVVELPEGVEVEEWFLTASSYSGKLRGVKAGVAKDGNYLYIQGLCEYLPDAWVKGTIDGNTATFATGQYYGQLTAGGETYDFFFAGIDPETGKFADVEFIIDEEAGMMVAADQYIYLLDGNNQWYNYYYDVIISQEELEAPEAIVAPEDLVAEPYHFKGVYEVEQEDGSLKEVEETRPIKVGFYGSNEVYIQGLSYAVEDAWVKGTIREGVVSIPETYLGIYEDYYVVGGNLYHDDFELFFSGATLAYDAETGMFTSADGYESYDSPEYGFTFDEYTDVVLTKVEEKVAIPAAPEITEFNIDGNYPYVTFNVPIEDVNGDPLLVDKLYYTLWIQKAGSQPTQLTLTKDLYENLTEDMTEIPYGFVDDWDFYISKVYLNQDEEEIASWTNIGIQSIYYGGDECRKSNIIWLEGEPTGISNVNAENGKAVYYDLQGRMTNASAKGLLIKQVRKDDGTVKTAKVVR